MNEDIQVYDFGSLESDLGGLYQDADENGWNDETFGALEDDSGAAPSVGRDFDFAGSTSRFLGTQPAGPQETSWTSTTHALQKPSPWSTLDADPLLSGRPLASPMPLSQPRQQQQQQQQQGPIVMRTLEEIEAELRAQAGAQRPMSAAPPRAGRTLEEVEAEMLRNARSPQPQAQQYQQQQPQQQYYPQQQQQQFPNQNYAPSPQQQQAYPPHPNSPFPPPPPFGGPPGMQGARPPQNFNAQQPNQQMPFPPQFQGQQGRPMNYAPPGMMPPPPLLRAAPPHQQQQQQQMSAQQQHMQASQFPPLGQQQASFPNAGPSSMLNTLFPPLPSQQGPASLEQQLQYLTSNQHAQHPSLTGAQLQNLLQQAQSQAQRGQELSAGGEGEEKTDKEKQVAAGEELIRNVEDRIREHEMMEQKRKLKAAKIAGMAKHNNLMSNSDKDFITRIQVSQLVTDDPYADDFYFHIMAAIKQSRMNAIRHAENPGMVFPNGQNGPNGGNMNGNRMGGRDRRPTRRENAMNKMAQNVQRLVDSAKQRNRSGQLNLDGALGKIALRTRSAPRQLLQVSTATSSTSPAPSAGHALLAGLISHSSTIDTHSTSTALDANGQQAPLSHRAVLAIVEEIYDSVLDLEQLRRVHPALLAAAEAEAAGVEPVAEGVERSATQGPAALALSEGNQKSAELADKLWTSLRVMEPLDISVPHPFISLISVLKGKRILPRAVRHLSPEQTLTLLTLTVATFDTLDTVRDAPLLDAIDDISREGSLERKQQRAAVETKTEVFLNAIISPVMGVIGSAPLRLVTGMLGLLMDRNDIWKVVKSKPGIAFLTIFLTRAESLKQATPPPEAQDLQQWQQAFGFLFHALAGDFPSLFPSTRAVSSLPFGASYYLANQAATMISTARPEIDLDDEPVWRFLAAVAVSADPQEQQDLVTAVREKVLENVVSAKKLKTSPELAALKIRNVDLLLNSLGLSATQLTVEE